MSTHTHPILDQAALDHLLALPSLNAQADTLASEQLLSAGSLADLLDLAESLVRSDPEKGRQLAALCAALAPRCGALALVPRAHYLCAQAHALNAEFDAALALIEAAYQGYSALGNEPEALRTSLGRMGVLLDLGRDQEALDIGRFLLRQLASLADDPGTRDEAQRLRASVQQNMGIGYEQMGHYEAALHAYGNAEALFSQLHLADRIGDIKNNRGLVLLSLGRGQEALAAFSEAAAIFTDAQQTLLLAQTLLNIGDAHLLLSNYTQSLASFRQARQMFEALHALADQHILLLDTADAYLALNLYPEAVASYGEAAALLRAVGMSHDLARAQWGMGTALSAQARYQEATAALAEAEAIFANADNLPLRASVLLEQAALEAARGRRDVAQEQARGALALIAGHDWPLQHAYAHLQLADLALPDLARAEAHLQQAQPVVERLALPPLRYRLHQRLGHIRLHQGRAPEAQALLEAAVDTIEQMRGGLAYETLRATFLHDKTAAYDDLVQLRLAQNDAVGVWGAFEAAERAKSRALVDLLSGVRTSLAPEAGKGAEELALEADLHATYSELLRSASAAEQDAHLPYLRARAAELEQQLGRLRVERVGATPVGDVLAPALAFDAVREQLPREGALVAYHIVGDAISAFVWAHGRLDVVRGFASLADVQRLIARLDAQWERFRVGGGFAQQHQGLLEQSAQRVLAMLYTALVAPVASFLDLASGEEAAPCQLTLVPHGALHQVPFHALFDGQRYLIERCELAYAPSVTVLALLAHRAPRATGRALVVGVPDPSIPAVAAEVRQVAQTLDGVTVRLAVDATRAALLADVDQYAHLHLACHGQFRSDNPIFSALKLHDGWLTAADVLDLDLDGVRVVLSACESGRSRVLGGDEILGFTRAFLGAGALTLVVSLWLAQDATTASLMTSFYKGLAEGARPAAALRQAQLALKAEHSHPFYWAPFVLVGQR